ncbi:MAG: Sua5/YciO/YrdC/YwlC family protein, partial [Kiritimatiellae bacterium]|nr:Sua5/YciO/YrdC/YwlC family protein [Kiritimatiellia bacterium]
MEKFSAPLSPADLARLGEVFRAGGIVLVPTDTVYGVAAESGRADALARIVAAEGRDPSKPCQLLAENAEAAKRAGITFPPAAAAVAARFWPGPLTLVLDLPGGGTEGVRVPDSAA